MALAVDNRFHRMDAYDRDLDGHHTVFPPPDGMSAAHAPFHLQGTFGHTRRRDLQRRNRREFRRAKLIRLVAELRPFIRGYRILACQRS